MTSKPPLMTVVPAALVARLGVTPERARPVRSVGMRSFAILAATSAALLLPASAGAAPFFSTPDTIGTHTSAGLVEPIVADQNCDGRDDVITADGSNFQIRLQLAGGAFAPATTTPTGRSVKDMTALPLQGDADLDPVTVGGEYFHGSLICECLFYSVGAGDVDGDGRPDAIAALHDDNSGNNVLLYWFRNNVTQPPFWGDENGASQNPLTSGVTPKALAVGDFTGDGRAEAAYRSEERRVGKECRSRWSPYH